jgi:hypothetical protein
VRNVRAEDVTDNKPMLCIEDDSPNVTADIWTGRGSAIPFSAKYLPWFFQRGDSTRARQPTRVAPTLGCRHSYLRGWCNPSNLHAAVGAANPKMLGRLLLRRISSGGPANQSSTDSRLPSVRARSGNRPVADTWKSAAGSAFLI